MVFQSREAVAPNFASAGVPIVDLAGKVKMNSFDIVG